jgi:hypothetical protein
MYRSLDPEWNQRFELLVTPADMLHEGSHLTISIFDKDVLDSDDLIGAVRLPLASIRNSLEPTTSGKGGSSGPPQVGKEGVKWYRVYDADGKSAGEISLDLHIGEALPGATVSTYVHASDFVAAKVISREEFDQVLACYPFEVRALMFDAARIRLGDFRWCCAFVGRHRPATWRGEMGACRSHLVI